MRATKPSFLSFYKYILQVFMAKSINYFETLNWSERYHEPDNTIAAS